MTIHRPRDWPVGHVMNTPSSAASFGFDIAAELARINHPTYAPYLRADLLARVLPIADESEVGRPADRRRHGDRSRPTAAAVGAASNPHSAGVRRGLIAIACCFVVGIVVGRRR